MSDKQTILPSEPFLPEPKVAKNQPDTANSLIGLYVKSEESQPQPTNSDTPKKPNSPETPTTLYAPIPQNTLEEPAPTESLPDVATEPTAAEQLNLQQPQDNLQNIEMPPAADAQTVSPTKPTGKMDPDSPSSLQSSPQSSQTPTKRNAVSPVAKDPKKPNIATTIKLPSPSKPAPLIQEIPVSASVALLKNKNIDEWFIGTVVEYTRHNNVYTVQDVGNDLTTLGKVIAGKTGVLTAPPDQIIKLPLEFKEMIEIGKSIKKGDVVLGHFPDTTCMYKATVQKTIEHVGESSNVPLQYELLFDDDTDAKGNAVVRKVRASLVVPYPKR